MPYELERSVYALIVSERAKQIDDCGFDDANDDAHENGELARLGAFFLMPGEVPISGGFMLGVDTLLPEHMRGHPKVNRSTESSPGNIELRIRDIVKGLACGVAEVQRLQRLAGVNPEILED